MSPKRKTKKGARQEKLLVVFCSNLTNPYYVMLLQGIESRAKEQGIRPLCLQYPERLENGGGILK